MFTILFVSYLTNRPNAVIFNGHRSAPYLSTSGVPQRSSLGPLLFLIFINPIISIISCFFELFADDGKFYLRIRSLLDCQHLQANLTALSSWCKINKLPINEYKCKVMTFSRSQSKISYPYMINNVQLKVTNSCRDLGITFDCILTFTDHIAFITKSALRTLGFVIRATKNFKNPNAIKALYIALVCPKLEYADVVWSPIYKKDVSIIERI